MVISGLFPRPNWCGAEKKIQFFDELLEKCKHSSSKTFLIDIEPSDLIVIFLNKKTHLSACSSLQPDWQQYERKELVLRLPKKNDILRTFWQTVCVAIELLLGLEYKTTWTLPLVFEFMVNSVENCWGIANKKKHSYLRRIIYVSIL